MPMQEISKMTTPVPNTSTRASQVANIEQMFAYNINAFAVPFGTAQTYTVNINSNYDWVCLMMTGVITDATPALVAFPLLNFNFRLANGQLLSDNPFFWLNMVGTGQLPMYLPLQIEARRDTKLYIDFANFSAAANYWVRATLLGYLKWN
jgi:hypothetical protein